MARTTPTVFPDQIVVGDTLNFKRLYSDFLPGDGWTLKHTLVNSANSITFSSTTDSDYHLVNVEAITTAEWVAGTYQWQAYVESDTSPTDRYTVDRGTVELVDDYSAGAVDDRSHVKKTLDLIEAEIESRVSGSVESYSIRDRSLSKTTMADLMAMRTQYRTWYAQEVRQEQMKLGKKTSQQVLVRFTDN